MKHNDSSSEGEDEHTVPTKKEMETSKHKSPKRKHSRSEHDEDEPPRKKHKKHHETSKKKYKEESEEESDGIVDDSEVEEEEEVSEEETEEEIEYDDESEEDCDIDDSGKAEISNKDYLEFDKPPPDNLEDLGYYGTVLRRLLKNCFSASKANEASKNFLEVLNQMEELQKEGRIGDPKKIGSIYREMNITAEQMLLLEGQRKTVLKKFKEVSSDTKSMLSKCKTKHKKKHRESEKVERRKKKKHSKD